MLLSCKCLNVLLDVEPDDAGLLNLHNLQLKDALARDVFFDQDVRQVLRLSKVTNALPTFVRRRTIDNWSFDQCLNCRTHTHATMTGAKGASFVLVNSALISDRQIEALKKHPSYSAAYKVLVFDSGDAEHRRFDFFSPEVETSLRALKHQADECIRAETLRTEERVRAYADQQAHLLDDFKDKARADHKQLARALLAGAVPRRSSSSHHDADGQASSALRKVPDDFDRVKTPSPQRVTIMEDAAPAASRKQTLKKKNSLDAECLFDIEGMDDDDDSQAVDTSDGEDNGIPVKQNRHARKHADDYSIAKSLPMNIPVYLRPHLNDDSDEDPIQSEKSKDIAASIQALARSVNGDTVFGELPRPRCSTNIM